ncbi:MAG: transposase [Bacteroidota bacterium]
MITQLPAVGEIKRFFPTHRICVVKVFILLSQCIIRCRTVCLYKCRAEFGSILGRKDLNINSTYTRLIRFFKIKKIDAFCIGIIRLIIHLIDFQDEVYMSIDRTNWKIGLVNINVCYIGLILPNGIFIPVLWRLYNKRGNTSEAERIELIEQFFKLWQLHEQIKITLLGDREFIGGQWFGFMKKVGFSFVIRARWQDYWKQLSISTEILIPNLEDHIIQSINQKGYFQELIFINGESLVYTVFVNTSKRQRKNDKWMVLISDQPDVEWIRVSFPKRWSIEVFFYHNKSNGFNLEDLNLIDELKAQLMMAVTAFCYVLSILKGIEHRKIEKIRLKSYNGKKSKSISLFRLGYDNLKNSIHSVHDLVCFIIDHLPQLPIWKSTYWKMGFKSV